MGDENLYKGQVGLEHWRAMNLPLADFDVLLLGIAVAGEHTSDECHHVTDRTLDCIVIEPVGHTQMGVARCYSISNSLVKK
jgi:hypothetical protein